MGNFTYLKNSKNNLWLIIVIVVVIIIAIVALLFINGNDGEYDYIICGGGTAGCTTAEIISRDPRNRVLVLELGDRRDDNPLVKISGGVSETDQYAEFYYQYAQQRQFEIPQNLFVLLFHLWLSIVNHFYFQPRLL